MNLNHVSTVFTVLLTFLPIHSAQAYLDPGTGSVIIQVLLGGIAGAMVIARMYWDKIRSFFGRDQKSQTATNQQDPGNDSAAANAPRHENRDNNI